MDTRNDDRFVTDVREWSDERLAAMLFPGSMRLGRPGRLMVEAAAEALSRRIVPRPLLRPVMAILYGTNLMDYTDRWIEDN
jgi:hypothetical protein